MTKKVWILLDQPLDTRNRERFGVNSYLHSNVLAGVIDLTRLTHPLVYADFLSRGASIDSVGVKYFSPSHFYEIVSYFYKFSDCDYLIYLSDNSFASSLIGLFCLWRGTKVVHFLFSFPQPSRSLSPLRIIRKLRAIPRLTRNVLFNFFVPKDVVILTTSLNEKNYKKLRAQKFYSHALDYDLFLADQMDCSVQSPSCKNIITFIDEDMLNHANYIQQNIVPSITKDNYFASLDNFFTALESQFDINVVVAEHPRSRYSNSQKNEYFYGRTVIASQTYSLIKNSLFVVSHSSKSIDIAVLLRKPIILLTTNEIKLCSRQSPLIKSFSELLGIPIVNSDCPTSFDNIAHLLSFSNSLYDRYIDTYIKHPESACNLSNADLIKSNLL